IIGGKPHPDDKGMIGMIAVWNEIYSLSKKFPNLAILAGYDPIMSKVMKAGVDLWFSSPRVPIEACSTSGMSAAMNGANLMSTSDGWICEVNPDEVFLYGTHIPVMYEQDVFDASELRSSLDNVVMPMYYNRKNEWYDKVLRIKRTVETHYNSDRMLSEYCDRMYAF
ncbi:MAG: alpha-glucan family phosphorylase, partial [Patescibacteria group bacterium]